MTTKGISMKSHVKAAVAAAFALALSASPASAATITGLFNTGTDSNNAALTPAGTNGLVDPHYLIFASGSPGFAGQQAVTYYNGAYAANDGDSRWISLTANGTPANTVSTYRLTFDLTGLDHTTASITGSWGADNSSVMQINGTPTGNVVGGFSSLSGFTVNSGFVSGINHLDFIVTDVGVVTALRVDNIAGTANLANAIPEPATWAMLIGGFGLVGGAMRRRRGAVALA